MRIRSGQRGKGGGYLKEDNFRITGTDKLEILHRGHGDSSTEAEDIGIEFWTPARSFIHKVK